jgi:hypothetical protein
LRFRTSSEKFGAFSLLGWKISTISSIDKVLPSQFEPKPRAYKQAIVVTRATTKNRVNRLTRKSPCVSTRRVVSPSLHSSSRVSGSTRRMSVSTSRVPVSTRRVDGVDSWCLDASTESGREPLLRLVVSLFESSTPGSTRRLLVYCKMDDEYKVEALTFF